MSAAASSNTPIRRTKPTAGDWPAELTPGEPDEPDPSAPAAPETAAGTEPEPAAGA